MPLLRRLAFIFLSLFYFITFVYRLIPFQDPFLSWLLMLAGALMPWFIGIGFILLLGAIWGRFWPWVGALAIMILIETGVPLWRSQGPYLNVAAP